MNKADASGINKLVIPAKAAVGQTKAAVKWFVDRVKDRFRTSNKIPADTEFSIGHMYLFRYDAKHKDKLPYWDAAPLVFPLEHYKDGFLGINLHYLPPNMRGKLVSSLAKNYMQGSGERRYLRLSYEKLSAVAKLRMFQPCLKRYLYTQMRSKPQRIPHAEWQNAVLLPSANWQGASASRVYRDSISRI